jgi:hypothetical protein
MSSPALPRHRTRPAGVRPALAAHPVPAESTAALAAPAEDDRIHALQAEIEQLRTAMASRAVIEQAKGVLMLLTGCNERAAFDLLTHISSHTHRKVRDISTELVSSASGRSPLPADVKAIVRDACPPSAPMH